MSNISILFLESKNSSEIDYQILCDLGLDRIFDSHILSILKIRCSNQEILARQEIFKELIEDNSRRLYSSFTQLRHSLFDFKHALDIFNVSNDFEKLFCFRNVLNSYINLLNDANLVQSNSILLKNFNSSINNHINKIDGLRMILKQFDDTMSLYHTIMITKLTNRFEIVRDGFQNNVQDFYSIISGFAETCNYPLAEKRDNAISLIDIVREAIIKSDHKLLTLFDNINVAIKMMDRSLVNLISEIDFYFNILSIVDIAKEHGIPYCFANFSYSERFNGKKVYDITMIKDGFDIIPNDVLFTGDNHNFFLIGMNGGGKTTYLRSIGANLVLFSSGCPIFANEAVIMPGFNVFTHFPKNEVVFSGRLDYEIDNIKKIIDRLHPNDWVLINEAFSSTNDKNGSSLALDYMNYFKKNGINCLFVTHLSGIYFLNNNLLQCQIDTFSQPTFVICDAANDNVDYTINILQKYHIDKKSLKERIVD